MSRSYKKNPIFRDNLWGRSNKSGKQYNNRKIRRKIKDISIDVGNGKDYERFGLDSWDLWEYKSYQTKQNAIDDWEKDKKDILNGINSWKSNYQESKEEAIKNWYLSYKRK